MSPASDANRVHIFDTTLRDAHQCLWATRMTTAMMLPVAERIDRCGYEQVDLAGTIQFDVCVRFLKEDPWLRVRLMRERRLAGFRGLDDHRDARQRHPGGL